MTKNIKADTQTGTRYESLTSSLERIYHQFNRPVYIEPDPLQFLSRFSHVRDREIAGFLAASLAYGQVLQINKAVQKVLSIIRWEPYIYVVETDDSRIFSDFEDFKYRFAAPEHMAHLMIGIKQVIQEFASLEACFLTGYSDTHDTVLSGLTVLVKQINRDHDSGHLCADPARNSACKRSNLFLRWMVRQDAVDPGGWDRVCPSKLMIPLDTHMHRIGILLGFTCRKSADLKTAMEITRGFRKIIPHDPVKYDFALTRYGIRQDLDIQKLKECLS